MREGPLTYLHGEEMNAASASPKSAYLHNIRMLQHRSGVGFARESCQQLRVGGETLV